MVKPCLKAVSDEDLKAAFIKETSRDCPDQFVRNYIASLAEHEQFAYEVLKELLAQYIVYNPYGLNKEGCLDDFSLWRTIIHEDTAQYVLKQAVDYQDLCADDKLDKDQFLSCLTPYFYSDCLQALWLDLQYGKNKAVNTVFKHNNHFGLAGSNLFSWPSGNRYSLEDITQPDLSKN